MRALAPEEIGKLMESESARIDRTLNSDEQVLAWPDGHILRPSALTHAYTKKVRKAGLDGFRFHGLRHTHASLLLRSRVPVKIVSERLGHSNVATLWMSTYTCFPVTMQRRRRCLRLSQTLMLPKCCHRAEEFNPTVPNRGVAQR